MRAWRPALRCAGCKKVQQDLARPGMVERFMQPRVAAEGEAPPSMSASDTDCAAMRTSFAGLWGLDDLTASPGMETSTLPAACAPCDPTYSTCGLAWAGAWVTHCLGRPWHTGAAMVLRVLTRSAGMRSLSRSCSNYAALVCVVSRSCSNYTALACAASHAVAQTQVQLLSPGRWQLVCHRPAHAQTHRPSSPCILTQSTQRVAALCSLPATDVN